MIPELPVTMAAATPAPPIEALRPEERLMIAVLMLACDDLSLAARGPDAARIRGAARSWIESDCDSWPFSFVRICRHFGVDVGAARRALTSRRDPYVRLDAALGRCG